MQRALRAERAGRWPAERTAGTVTLTFDDRHRRRLRLASDAGEEFFRHLPTRIEAHRILIRRDHVIADMLSQLGATLRSIEAPFTPERGAYDGDAGHSHEHAHHHAHD